MKMSNKTYDFLKWLSMVVLPAVAVFYAALAKTWGWPYGPEITATLAAVTAFMGTVLQISSANHKADNLITENR